jgi:hypothetical protein
MNSPNLGLAIRVPVEASDDACREGQTAPRVEYLYRRIRQLNWKCFARLRSVSFTRIATQLIYRPGGEHFLTVNFRDLVVLISSQVSSFVHSSTLNVIFFPGQLAATAIRNLPHINRLAKSPFEFNRLR